MARDLYLYGIRPTVVIEQAKAILATANTPQKAVISQQIVALEADFSLANYEALEDKLYQLIHYEDYLPDVLGMDAIDDYRSKKIIPIVMGVIYEYWEEQEKAPIFGAGTSILKRSEIQQQLQWLVAVADLLHEVAEDWEYLLPEPPAMQAQAYDWWSKQQPDDPDWELFVWESWRYQSWLASVEDGDWDLFLWVDSY